MSDQKNNNFHQDKQVTIFQDHRDRQIIDIEFEELSKNINRKFVVPPGLHEKVSEFHALIETCAGVPILITGPTGVGKSLFIHIYSEWYKQRKGKGAKITTVNCSHMEKSLSRSELFGHIKGAFTGAIRDKKGWIEEADGGLLILDEIGELPDECQAQLLTFIEDNKYHRVGENKIREVKDLNIIGATNRNWNQSGKQLRDDLWNRFITFNIPPLYMRRGDVLYYIASMNPDIIKDLHQDDVLALLSYNWPGNVREINRVISVLKSRYYLRKINPVIRGWDSDTSGLYDLNKEHTGLSLDLTEVLYEKLINSGFDLDNLELLLNEVGIGLSHEEKKVFKKFKEKNLYNTMDTQNSTSFEDIINNESIPGDDNEYKHLNNKISNVLQKLYDIKMLKEYEPFDEAMVGYELFCWFFLQSKNTDRNVLVEVLNRNVSTQAEYPYGVIFKNKKTEDLITSETIERLSLQAFEFMKGSLSIREEVMVKPYDNEKRKFISRLREKYFNDEDLYTTIQLEQPDKKDEMDIFLMTEKDFKKYYYVGLLKRYPTIRKIAEVLGVKEQSMYSKIKSLKKEGIVS